MFKRIDHVEITPGDMERALAFYQEILGFSLASRIPLNSPPLREIAYLKLGDTMIELLGVEEPVPASQDLAQIGYRGLALEVDDMEETLRDLSGKGIGVAWGPVNLGDSIRAEIRDPDGLVIELRQWF